ncbi:hypothetical protein GCM10008967_04580 [Bacillus carboniphilus]|uniref:Uncharacterized protein n=1 Tax=Bacillus carboniphilus TaxID=86663 RepID=A0ABN0VTQ3_9BACI
MNEYYCPDCEVSELSLEIIPNKRCPQCDVLMECIESDEE